MVQTKTPGNFVSVQEAAEIVGVTEGRIRQLLAVPKKDGGLDGFKINGRAWVIARKDAEKLRDTPSDMGRPRSCDEKK